MALVIHTEFSLGEKVFVNIGDDTKMGTIVGVKYTLKMDEERLHYLVKTGAGAAIRVRGEVLSRSEESF